MKKYKLSRDTLAALDASGLHISSLWQMPQNDGRKLKNVAETTDPWRAQLFYPDVVTPEFGPISWHASFIAYGEGPTADEAVRQAIAESKGLEGLYRRLGAAIAHTTETLHVARTGRSYAGT